MITLSMLAVGVAMLLAAVALMSVVATRDPMLIPATVGPYARIGAIDATTETLPTGKHTEPTTKSEWNIIELNSLFGVEALLDSLEASNATNTEVEVIGEDKFTVRWR